MSDGPAPQRRWNRKSRVVRGNTVVVVLVGFLVVLTALFIVGRNVRGALSILQVYKQASDEASSVDVESVMQLPRSSSSSTSSSKQELEEKRTDVINKTDPTTHDSFSENKTTLVTAGNSMISSQERQIPRRHHNDVRKYPEPQVRPTPPPTTTREWRKYLLSQTLARMQQQLDDAMGNYTRIGDPLIVPHDSIQPKRRAAILKPDGVEYVGVLLDAGRFYYPMDWIYHMIDYISLMGFNLLHFRLTDDPSFNVRLQSHPEFAVAAPGSNQTYTVDELRAMVQYADDRGIAIMPEINVPGHAGAWGGSIPYLVVPCATYICRKNFGVPLNISHPQLIPILQDVIQEVMSIFTTAPFLHLGGDELSCAKDCFQELGLTIPNYNAFEEQLGQVLTDLNISHDKIVRWEVSKKDFAFRTNRIATYNHYWMTRPHEIQKGKLKPTHRGYFVSKDLYFDVNGDENASAVFDWTRAMWQNSDGTDRAIKPKAIIATAFELGVDFWYDKNVLGRLLAVAMGTSRQDVVVTANKNTVAFEETYQAYCSQIGLPTHMCRASGVPMLNNYEYQNAYNFLWKKVKGSDWPQAACRRLARTIELDNGTVYYEPKPGALV